MLIPALPTKEMADNKYPVINEKKAIEMTKTYFLFKVVILD